MTYRDDLYKRVSTPHPCGNGTIEYRWFVDPEHELVFLFRGELSSQIRALLETSADENLAGLKYVHVRKRLFRKQYMVHVTTSRKLTAYTRLDFAQRFEALCVTFKEKRPSLPASAPRGSSGEIFGFEPA